MPRQDEEYLEIVSLHRENAEKLASILDLETILLNTAICNMDDGSPCWCGHPFIVDGLPHTAECEAARRATKHLWNPYPA